MKHIYTTLCRVALIDADIGLRNLDLLLGLENRVVFTAMEVLEGECRLDQVRVCVGGDNHRVHLDN